MDEDYIEIFAPVESFKILSDQLDAAKIQPEEGELRMLPNQELELGKESTIKAMKAIEALEDLDDVQNVFSNLNFSEEALAVIAAE